MADETQRQLLIQDVQAWNKWRKENSHIKINLESANLSFGELSDADLSYANLNHADMGESVGIAANFEGASLIAAKFYESNFTKANFANSTLYAALFDDANLTEANFEKADLQNVRMVNTKLENAILNDSRIYGVSAWDIIGVPKEQRSLIITPVSENDITVDDIQVAQFIYLLLNNKNIRNVIDTLTTKAVLILGRFTNERKAVLDAIHNEIRKRDYLPIIFDFTGPESRDLTETVSTLAHMSRFIIADLTDAKSIPQELQSIIPHLPSVPVQPILLSTENEYSMFEHFKRYPWVLDTIYYKNIDDIINDVNEKVIIPLENKFEELRK